MILAFDTLDELKDHLWGKLPRARRIMVGRKQVDDIIDIAVLEFPDDAMAACAEGSRDEEVLADAMLKACKRHYCFAQGEDQHNVGMIWTLILMNVASTIIGLLIRWWWENASRRPKLAQWRKGVERRNG